MNGILRKVLLALVSIMILSSIGLAQIATGRIVGTVMDTEMAPLPGVSVVATSPRLIGEASAVTDANGAYRLLNLAPGNYKITFALSGFKTVVHESVDLRVEQTLTVNTTMEMAALEEDVTVIGTAPLIDVKSTTKGMTLEKNVFAMLPRSRNFESLVTIVAGANEETKAGGTSVDGATGLENMYYFDGMDTTDAYRGYSGQQAAFEFIEEVQIKSSGYQAEFGGSLGGVINVITRSGGNEFHGEIIGYYTGSALTGKERDTLRLNPYDSKKAELVNYQDMYGKDKIDRIEAGFSLGGYIFRDRVWFFGSALPVFRNTTRHVNWLTGETPEGDYEEKYKYYNFMGKISAQALKNLRISASVLGNSSTFSGALPDRKGYDDPTFPYGQVGFDYPNLALSGTADLTLGNNFMINMRGGYFLKDETNQRLKPPGVRFVFRGPGACGWDGKFETNAIYPDLIAMYPDYIRPAGFTNFPDAQGFETKKLFTSRLSANLDTSYYFNLAGEHVIKAGFQWVRLVDKIDRAYTNDLIYLGWDDSYLIYGQTEPVRGQYGVYAVASPPEYGNIGKGTAHRSAIYLQDSWTIAKKLTLNIGIRAESEDIPSYSSDPEYAGTVFKFDFMDKIAPRLGVIYDVFGDSSLKIFANAGLYYDVMKLNLARNQFGASVRNFSVYTLDDPKWWTFGDGNYPGTFINKIFNDYTGAFERVEPDLKPMYQGEIALGVEKTITKDLSASIRVVRKHLFQSIEDIGVFTPSGQYYYIGNPGRGIILPESQGGLFDDRWPAVEQPNREYFALNLEIEKRFSSNWVGGLSYTLSRLWGYYTGLAWTELGSLGANLTPMFDKWFQPLKWTTEPINDPMPTDRPHYLKLWGSYSFDFGLTVGAITQASSGTPVSRMLYAPVSWCPDGYLTDGRTPFIWTANLYVEYALKIRNNKLVLSLNVDNVFDAKTVTKKYERINNQPFWEFTDDLKATGTWDYRTKGYDPDPRFLMPLNFLPPIQATLGMKFMF